MIPWSGASGDRTYAARTPATIDAARAVAARGTGLSGAPGGIDALSF
jgi:hypothetical protein